MPGGRTPCFKLRGVFRDLIRDRARTLPVADSDSELEALRVWFCSYRSLTTLERFTTLRTLIVADYPDEDLEPIGRLANLEYLRILHLPHVTDLSPLGRLQKLRTIRLATLPSWDSSGKVTTVDSLAPLATLPELEHVELFGVRPRTGSLFELEGALKLRSVRVSKYENREIARFREATALSDEWAPNPGVADWH